MKRILTILYSLSILLIGSCTKDADVVSIGIGSAVEFSVSDNIISKVSTQDSFATNDTIGIYMDDASGATLSSNVKYTVGTEGLTYSSGGQILYPTSGETVTFYAFSPYPTVKDGVIAIDILNDTKELLVSDKPTGSQSSTTPISLTFAHTLSKLAITYTPTAEAPALSKAYVIGSTKASYTIATSTLAATDADKATIEATLNTNADDTQSVDAIILPDNKDNSIDIYFEYTANGEKLAKKITLYTQAFSSGYIYTYDLILGDDEATLCAHDIIPWSDEDLSSTTTTKYVGDGSEDYPWAIYTQAEFASIGTTGHKFERSDCYILMNDIAFSYDDGESWTPIGSSSSYFTGSFDGGGYEISNLQITATANNQGLFGYIQGATIKNLSVAGTISSTKAHVGGIAGYATSSSKITNCSSSVNISNDSNSSDCQYYGGIVGCVINATIDNCYNAGSVTGYDYVGGIAGYLDSSATVINCWCSSASSVTASSFCLGGIVGCNIGKIYNSYNQGTVSGTTYFGAGIVGHNYSGIVDNCYNTGTLTASYYKGGIAYNNDGTITNCYYLDSEGVSTGVYTSTVATSTTALTSAQMSRARFADWMENNAIDVDGAYAWDYDPETKLPLLVNITPVTTAADITYDSNGIYKISSGYGLRAFADMVNGAGENTHMAILGDDTNFTFSTSQVSISGELSNDVDLSEVCGEDFENWSPIGYALYNNENTLFIATYTGTFNGNNHTISNIYINDDTYYYEGTALFGYTQNAKIHNLHVDGTVSGLYPSGIVGCASGSTIINAHSDVDITGSNAGGICAYSWSANIYNCYNSGEVSGTSSGGIVGNGAYGSINTCYNSYYASGVSGIIGNDNYVTLTSTYSLFDNVSSTAPENGKSEEEMKDAAFLSLLNNGAYTLNNVDGALNGNAIKAYAWEFADDDDFPTFDTVNTPTYTAPDIIYTNGIYEINSAKGLKAFADLVNGYENTSGAIFENLTFTSGTVQRSISAKLMYDIDLSTICSEGNDSWIPIAFDNNNASVYYATFDGNGKTISNLYIDTSLSNYPSDTFDKAIGLFGYVDGSTIKDLTVSGEIKSERTSTYYGGIVGSNGVVVAVTSSSTTARSTFSNCYSSVNITTSGNSTHTGGIVGYSYSLDIINCSYDGTISGVYAGGIAGVTQSDTIIENSYSNGSIYGSTATGGIAGSNYTYGSSTYTNCYSSAAITGTNCGGIIGSVGYGQSAMNSGDSVTITRCYWANNASGTAATAAYGLNNLSSSDDYTISTTEMTTAEMQATTFVAKLNAGATYITGAYGWSSSSTYPVLNANVTPTVDPSVYDIALSGTTYNIYSEAGLRAFANLVNGVNDDAGVFSDGTISFSDERLYSISGTLQNDITLTSEWTPIANVTSTTDAYSGTFDGNSKTISGLSITSASTESCQGLFGYIRYSAEIKNLTVDGDINVSVDHVGGIVGRAYAASAKITDCVSYVNVSGNSYVGGIVGDAYYTTLTRCGSNGKMKGLSDSGYVGGVAGYAYIVTFIDCYNKNGVEGSGKVGGVVGYAYGATSIYSSYNQGGVTNNDSDNYSYTSGIVGYYDPDGNKCYMNNCYNTGAISGGINTGDFTYVGSDGLSISYCYYLTVSGVGAYGNASGVTVTTSNNSPKSAEDMKDSDFVDLINTDKHSSSDGYKELSSGYPILYWENTTVN